MEGTFWIDGVAFDDGGEEYAHAVTQRTARVIETGSRVDGWCRDGFAFDVRSRDGIGTVWGVARMKEGR